MNELNKENSPYLIQHAQNPIHWKAWNPTSLKLAKDNNKLLIISIGYSTCHWCHVMEHESFENNEVAEIMNANFVSIKIDREEFPDIDAHYMKAIQIMTKQGGWPLNVVCLPDGRPIWGGTYFPKETWVNSLSQLHNLYIENTKSTLEFATKLQEGITILGQAPHQNLESRFNLEVLLANWSKSFDTDFGGYTRAPKFMMPTNLSFLQLHGYVEQDTALLNYIDTTLTRMAWGGIFDPLEGGFSRYSVDFKWHVPHFEKMLYDNAQLLSVYADAYKRTQNELYKEVIEKTISFITTNWSNTDGGYYSALDADSINKKEVLEEGAYYVWTKEELKQLLGPDFELFSTLFNINEIGLWEEDNYVLFQNTSLEKIALNHSITLLALQTKKKTWEKLLLENRNNRPRPRLDHKIICSWNMMYAIGLLDAYSALQDKTYFNLASNLIQFTQQNLWTEDQGLYRIYNTQKKTILACLDDYAYYIQALINLFQHTGRSALLLDAKNALNQALDLFFDDSSGFFFYSQSTSANISKQIETEDNVIPSSNALMAINLLQLGLLFENLHYSQIATKMTAVVLSQIDYPSAYSHWLIANTMIENPKELSVVGKNSIAEMTEVTAQVASHLFIIPVTEESKIPYLSKYSITDESKYYFCVNRSCQNPVNKETFLMQNQPL